MCKNMGRVETGSLSDGNELGLHVSESSLFLSVRAKSFCLLM